MSAVRLDPWQNILGVGWGPSHSIITAGFDSGVDGDGNSYSAKGWLADYYTADEDLGLWNGKSIKAPDTGGAEFPLVGFYNQFTDFVADLPDYHSLRIIIGGDSRTELAGTTFVVKLGDDIVATFAIIEPIFTGGSTTYVYDGQFGRPASPYELTTGEIYTIYLV